jgi:hypothetical protein
MSEVLLVPQWHSLPHLSPTAIELAKALVEYQTSSWFKTFVDKRVEWNQHPPAYSQSFCYRNSFH